MDQCVWNLIAFKAHVLLLLCTSDSIWTMLLNKSLALVVYVNYFEFVIMFPISVKMVCHPQRGHASKF